MQTITMIATLTLMASATPTIAQDHAAHGTQAKPVIQTFEHYEGVRAALSADKFAGVAPHAKQLAASVDAAGGAEARKAAEALAAATTIEDARKHFGEVSRILVPLFQAEKIPGAKAFMCDMKKQPWMQKGDKVENPYYGKSMSTCGSPLAAPKK